jgi:3-oxocholest-4-en-26-oate---CoA ligase
MSEGWNYADIWEAIADRYPNAVAQNDSLRSFTWRAFDTRADGVAQSLLDAGLTKQSKVAQYLRNCSEYLESTFGCFKAGFVPVNTNYRYREEELEYLWNDADVEAVIFQVEFIDHCEQLRQRLPRIRMWLCVGDPDCCPDWALAYEEATRGSGRVVSPWSRTGNDIYLLYTGGTTGVPKGVMWRQDDLFRMLESSYGRSIPRSVDGAHYATQLVGLGPRVLPCAPLMHGGAAWFAMQNLCRAGSVFVLPGGGFEPIALLDAIEEHRIQGIAIVGDAFARPILTAMEADPRRWDLSSLRLLLSSGAMLSAPNKTRLLRQVPGLTVVDTLGTSESGGMGSSKTTAKQVGRTATFQASPNVRVIDDSGRDIPPEIGGIGRLAVAGYLPVGYYKDPLKTASTFIELDGDRYVIPGDYAELQPDGVIRLLGRGSVCINTGGEKVFPEEVEEVLKLHPAVHDTVVLGMPDDRLGECVTALIEFKPGLFVDDEVLIAHVKAHLAGYKAPRLLIRLDSIGRQPSGKVDYRTLRAKATQLVRSMLSG